MDRKADIQIGNTVARGGAVVNDCEAGWLLTDLQRS